MDQAYQYYKEENYNDMTHTLWKMEIEYDRRLFEMILSVSNEILIDRIVDAVMKNGNFLEFLVVIFDSPYKEHEKKTYDYLKKHHYWTYKLLTSD